MAQEYYSQLTNYGADLINQHVLSGEPFIMQGWSIALGTGALEPTPDTTELVNKIFDKNSEFYPGITYGTDENYGRFAQIVLPSTLEGNIITELGLYDENDKLVIACKCHEDLSIGITEGIVATRTERISLSVIPESVEVIYINENNYITRDEANEDFQKISEKAQVNGYAPLDENAKVPQVHIPDKLTKFSINNGKITNSVEDVLDADIGAISQELNFTNAGTYSIEIPQQATVEIDMQGADGGGAYAQYTQYDSGVWSHSANGGSGSKITGTTTVEAGTYTIVVGGSGNYSDVRTAFPTTADAYGGTGGLSSCFGNIANGGAGGHAVCANLGAGGGYAGAGGIAEVTSTGLTGVNGSSGASNYENGYVKLKISYSTTTSKELRFKTDVPITYTNANGETFTKYNLNSIDVSDLADGVYNCFLNSTNQPYLLNNTIYYAKGQPTSMNEGDVWLDKITLKAYKLVDNELVTFNDVPCGKVTIASGVIASLIQPYYNNNNAPTNEEYFIKLLDKAYIPDYDAGITFQSGFICPTNGFVNIAEWHNSGVAEVKVNDNTVWYSSSAGGNVTISYQGFVAKGDVITYSLPVTSGVRTILFYPLKGVLND